MLLDSGTTALQVARHIEPAASLVVVTNDVGIMNELVTRENVQLVFLGGTLRRKNLSFYGTQTERALQDLHVDKLFLAADGFDIEKGLTTHFEPEAISEPHDVPGGLRNHRRRRLLQIRPDLPAQDSRAPAHLETGDRHGAPGRSPRGADADRRRGHHRVKAIREIIAEHKAGRAVGHLFRLLRASAGDRGGAAHARRESGSGVDRGHLQSGQSGRRLHGHAPRGFQPLRARASRRGSACRREQVLLGGDHLGPNCWQDLPAEAAMAKSEQLIADYVARGLSQDSSGLLHVLCGRSDAAHRRGRGGASGAACAPLPSRPGSAPAAKPPVYVVGTEVPVPGGAQEALTELALTDPAGRHRNHRRPFGGVPVRGTAYVWPRVIGLVVQPGVEFDHHKVIDFHAPRAADLAARGRGAALHGLRSAFHRLPDARPICARWCRSTLRS